MQRVPEEFQAVCGTALRLCSQKEVPLDEDTYERKSNMSRALRHKFERCALIVT